MRPIASAQVKHEIPTAKFPAGSWAFHGVSFKKISDDGGTEKKTSDKEGRKDKMHESSSTAKCKERVLFYPVPST